MMTPTPFNRQFCHKIANLIRDNKLAEAADNLKATAASVPHMAGWNYNIQKLIPFLYNPESADLPYRTFAKGNGKLPFWSFSTLPIITCPGMGTCGKWCYSLKAWRYPAAFFRQIQNTILVKHFKNRLLDEANKLKKNVDVRLYVDGDIDSLETLSFWMSFLKSRPDLKAYGYSKSWNIFIEYHESDKNWPDNYQLNLSSGSRYQNMGAIRSKMKSLPIVRGEFIAVEAGRNPDAKSVRSAAKAAGMGHVFVCPGKCGSCLKVKGNTVHACGSKLMSGIVIVIGTH